MGCCESNPGWPHARHVPYLSKPLFSIFKKVTPSHAQNLCEQYTSDQNKVPYLAWSCSLLAKICPTTPLRWIPKDLLIPLSPFLQTQLMYKWAQPKICSEDLEGAANLPASGVKTICPPCNPGFFKTPNSTCMPCPYGSYSNGSGKSIPALPMQPLHPSTHSHKLPECLDA